MRSPELGQETWPDGLLAVNAGNYFQRLYRAQAAPGATPEPCQSHLGSRVPLESHLLLGRVIIRGLLASVNVSK